MRLTEDHKDVEGTGAFVMGGKGGGRAGAKSTGRVNLEKNGLRKTLKIHKYYNGQTRLFSVVSSDMRRAQSEKKCRIPVTHKKPLFYCDGRVKLGQRFPRAEEPTSLDVFKLAWTCPCPGHLL